MLKRQFRIILPYKKWRSNGLGISEIKFEELDLRHADFGLQRHISLRLSNLNKKIIEEQKRIMVYEIMEEMFKHGYTPNDFDIHFAHDTLLGSDWNTIGIRVSGFWEGTIEQYIADLRQKLQDLDLKFAEYQRRMERRGFIQTVRDWFIWKIREVKE